MRHATTAAFLFAGLILAGACAPTRQSWDNTFTGDGEDAFILDDDFVCLGDDSYQKVGEVRVKNVLGHEDEAVAVAQNKTKGDAYPVGTVIQLFPFEASVKRGAGFSKETHDWEFLTLNVDSGETVITARGTTDVSNLGGTCLSCHGQATDFDLACFSNDECPALPFFIDTHVDPSTDDARCKS